MASKDATSIEVIRDEIEGTNLGLGTSDLQLIDLYGALFEARAKWRPIGLELRLTPGTLDAIEQMKINPSDRLEAVLLHWLRVTRGASWKQVIDALRSALVGEIQLAEKLELKYCPPETGHREKRKYRSDDEQQLTNDIKSIEKKFTNLQTATRESLKKSDTVDLLSLVALLTSYRSSRAVIESESNMLLAHQQEELRRAASVDEVFVIVSPFWSFLDFEILEDVINKFGAESDQSDLATYFIELREFLNTWKVEPCKNSRLDDDKKRVKFCFKLDAESLAIYRDLKAAIARILKVPVYTLHLHSIEDGSIQLIFFFLGIVQLSFHQCDQIAQIIPSVLKVSLIHGSTSEIIFENKMAENEITTEIRKKVQAAVEAVAKEKFNESSHIDRVDLQTFLDAISVTRIEPVAPSCVLGGQQLVETNRTEREYLFPGNPSANASAHLNLAQQPLTGAIEGSVHFTANEQLDEQPRPIPPNAQRKHKQNISTHILYLTVQADCLVRVYGSKPLVIGASAVGTATGIAGGAVAGIAGGTTLAGSLAPVAGGGVVALAIPLAGTASGFAGGIIGGALIGSVVPVAGAIVGGIVGAILGGLGMRGRGAGVGTGVRIGAVDSKRTYKMIQAHEVFKKLQNFSVDKANACHCTIVANTFSSLDHRILYAND